MPIRRVDGGWQWGYHGTVYPTRVQAVAQARAAYAHGYRGNPEDETMHECPDCEEPCGCEDGELHESQCTHCVEDEETGDAWDDEYEDAEDDYADEERRGGFTEDDDED